MSFVFHEYPAQPNALTIKDLQKHIGRTPLPMFAKISSRKAVISMSMDYIDLMNAVWHNEREEIGRKTTDMIISSLHVANNFRIDFTETVNRMMKYIDEKSDRIETVSELQCAVDDIYNTLGKLNKNSIKPENILDGFLDLHALLESAVELNDKTLLTNNIVSIVLSMAALASMNGIDLEQTVNETI